MDKPFFKNFRIQTFETVRMRDINSDLYKASRENLFFIFKSSNSKF